ncbi:MAG: hypothetical protein CSA11_01155 [Chloroflexi bacterium]|nr:MAG: hypothetical protein CSB13_11595 [Chloroflexota bacterium]PIE82320.1 MAG: hypothetical protein CSA11_01155 [Chloroflexota bacterium]
MLGNIGRVHLEEQPDGLKVVSPIKRYWFLFALYTGNIIVWVAGVIGMLFFLVYKVIMAGERYSFSFSIILVVWMIIWLGGGRHLWRNWQRFAATREILFINHERLIIHRPVSIWGLTEAFDMKYVRPFSVSEYHQCILFDYGSDGNYRIYFGLGLTEDEASGLVSILNSRYFRDYDPDDDE